MTGKDINDVASTEKPHIRYSDSVLQTWIHGIRLNAFRLNLIRLKDISPNTRFRLNLA